MKIRHKLILAFGVLILILIAEIILNQVITTRSTKTYNTLQSEINPTISLLNHYESINKELHQLVNNRVNGDNKISTTNRLKGIFEVELNYIESELNLIREKLPQGSTDIILVDQLITDTKALLLSVEKFRDILNSKNNKYTSQKAAKSIFDHELTDLNLSINKNIDLLNLNYKRAFESYSNELANNLKSVSRIILFTGIFGILLALIITIQITYSISTPIHKLKVAALQMSRGNLDKRVQLKGKDELTELGNSFNRMAVSLKKSFNKQEKQIEQIKSINKELEQFVYVASHDLQEPLRTVNSYIGLIKELYISQLDSNAIKYMTHVEEASLRMKNLIKDLLDYSKIGKEKTVTSVDLKQIIEEILTDHELIIKDTNATVVYDEMPTIFGLKVELKQLFQNLINNGLKFRKENTAPRIEISVEEQSEYWLFSVKDNGIGMDQKYFERVFIIFQRLHNKNDYQGTGIGLSICKKIVDMHKGKIWIESELEQGSTFYFTIPKKLNKI